MISDMDVYRTANVLVERYGKDAVLEAAQRADSFLEAGDMDGSAVWRRELRAVKEILREEPREDEATH